MKLLKKLGIIILILSCISINYPTKATANSNLDNYYVNSKASEFLQIALDNPELYGLFNVSFDKLEISAPVSPYVYDKNDDLKKINNVFYYFICSNKIPIANIIACYDEETAIPSYTFETEAALKLAKSLEHSNLFTILFNDTLIDVIPTGDELLLTGELSLDFTQNNLQSLNTYDSYPSYYLLNIPYVSQGNFGLCWAASVASVGQYKTGKIKSAKAVADAMGVDYNDGGGIYLASEALTKIYQLSNSPGDVFIHSISMIADFLLSDQPIIAGFDNGKNGHMVVICGYTASSQGGVLIIRDPNYSYTKMISSGTDNNGNYTWLMPYYSDFGTLYWHSSIFVN